MRPSLAISSPIGSGVMLALAAAFAFGLATPVISRAGSTVGPLATAALLYAGAAAGAMAGRRFGTRSGPPPGAPQVPRLLAVALFGSIAAPTLLAWGIQRTGPTTASLVLNLEAVFSVLLARAVYGELLGPRVVAAVGMMLLGGAALAWDASGTGSTQLAGVLAVAAATACWGADNTLTKPLADFDPGGVVMAKGTLGSFSTATLAWLAGESAPALGPALVLLVCGVTGYGLSLHLYLLAQRRMGAARTASVFATGPFLGAAASWFLGDRRAGLGVLAGSLAFGLGVYLHATESHSHPHRHEPLDHTHAHRHDDGHHDHPHDPPVEGEHTHPHHHGVLEHDHPHAPDLHHAHPH